MKKHIVLYTLPIIAAFFVLLVLADIAHIALAASGEYTGGLVPANCRGTPGNNCPCRLCDLYQLGLNITEFLMQAIAAPLAALMLAWGGIKMLTSAGNPSAINEGKKILTTALIGIFLVFFGWIVIDTILTTLSFGFHASNFGAWYNKPNVCQEASGSCTPDVGAIAPIPESERHDEGGPGEPPPADATRGCQNLAEDGVIRQRLLNEGVAINAGPPQTCLDCLPETAISRLIAAQRACGTQGCIVVTGGTEPGHVSHMCGQAIVDIRYSSRAFAALGMEEDTQPPYFDTGKITCESGGRRVACGIGAQWMHTEF
ncbi:MAG TPA: pilin [Candidatus Paceibacterota bacterium]